MVKSLLGVPRVDKVRFVSNHSGEARLKDLVKKHSVRGFPTELCVMKSKEKVVIDSEEEDEERRMKTKMRGTSLRLMK